MGIFFFFKSTDLGEEEGSGARRVEAQFVKRTILIINQDLPIIIMERKQG